MDDPTAVTHTPAPTAADAGALAGHHPGWPAAVMGTGIVAIVARANPGNVPELAGLTSGIAVLAASVAWILGVVLLGAATGRWVRHPGAVLRDLRDPMMGALHGTFPAAVLVLAAVTAAVGPDVLPSDVVTTIVAVLALFGGVIGFVVGVAFVVALLTNPAVPPASPNGSWFIPPVVPVIVPLLVVPLLPHVDAVGERTLLALGPAGERKPPGSDRVVDGPGVDRQPVRRPETVRDRPGRQDHPEIEIGAAPLRHFVESVEIGPVGCAPEKQHVPLGRVNSERVRSLEAVEDDLGMLDLQPPSRRRCG